MYKHYKEINKGLLDQIKVGDLIRINNWKKPMRVKGVTENYFIMIQNNFGNTYYSVCEKKPWNGIQYNAMRGGMFHCSTDNMIFGSLLFPNDFNSIELVEAYLQEFERGDIELSARRAIPIYDLYVKG